MNKQSYVALVVLAVLCILAFFVVSYMSNVIRESSTVACTMEAKICPDGTSVGRSGPDCEFAPCPSEASCEGGACPPLDATSILRTASLGQKVTGLDVSITPLEIVSDSRCPIDVQCIWAGTVELKAKIESALGESTMTLTLGKSVTTEAEEITLTLVTPGKSAGSEIPGSSYRFTFLIKKR